MTATKRVCLISGASSGIGAACAATFQHHGWNVAAGYFGEFTPDSVPFCVEVPPDSQYGQVLPIPLDVTQNDQCHAAVDTVLATWGRLDALINCAGVTRFIPHHDFDSLDAQEFHRIYEVNLIGAFQLIRAGTAALQASEAGTIVNVSSIAGLRGTGSSMAYACSKGALNTMTLSMARSLAPNVRVNAIAPGFVDGGLPSRNLSSDQYDTLLQRQLSAAPLQRISQPQEIADLAWFLCTQAPAITGQVIVADNGLLL